MLMEWNELLYFRKLSKSEMLLWQPLMEDLLFCCLEISDIVSPVVQNSSPEGNVPEEAIKGKHAYWQGAALMLETPVRCLEIYVPFYLCSKTHSKAQILICYIV